MEKINCKFKIGDLVLFRVGTILTDIPCTIIEIINDEKCKYKLARENGDLITNYFFDEDLEIYNRV